MFKLLDKITPWSSLIKELAAMFRPLSKPKYCGAPTTKLTDKVNKPLLCKDGWSTKSF